MLERAVRGWGPAILCSSRLPRSRAPKVGWVISLPLRLGPPHPRPALCPSTQTIHFILQNKGFGGSLEGPEREARVAPPPERNRDSEGGKRMNPGFVGIPWELLPDSPETDLYMLVIDYRVLARRLDPLGAVLPGVGASPQPKQACGLPSAPLLPLFLPAPRSFNPQTMCDFHLVSLWHRRAPFAPWGAAKRGGQARGQGRGSSGACSLSPPHVGAWRTHVGDLGG